MASKFPRGVKEVLDPVMDDGESLVAATFADARTPAAHHVESTGRADSIPKGDVLVAVTDRRIMVFPRKGMQIFNPFVAVQPNEYYRVVWNSPVIGTSTLDMLFIDGSHLWFGLPSDNSGRWVAQQAMAIVADDSAQRDLTSVTPQPMASGAFNPTGLVFADTLSAQTLADFEAIRRTKYRYVRCIDQKLWDELATTLTPDCVATYSGGEDTCEGRDAIVDFLKRTMGAETVHSSTRVYQPEIAITGPATATATWAADDVVIVTELDQTRRGAGFYQDDYHRQDGIWRISRTVYKCTFEETQPRSNVPGLRLTGSWWTTNGQSETA